MILSESQIEKTNQNIVTFNATQKQNRELFKIKPGYRLMAVNTIFARTETVRILS